jgi:hypothetical protein
MKIHDGEILDRDGEFKDTTDTLSPQSYYETRLPRIPSWARYWGSLYVIDFTVALLSGGWNNSSSERVALRSGSENKIRMEVAVGSLWDYGKMTRHRGKKFREYL